MKEEGLDNIFLGTISINQQYNAVKALNLELFADEKYLSPSITAIKTGELDAEVFRKIIKINTKSTCWRSRSPKRENFQNGHLGYVNDRDIITVISAISNTLLDLGKITVKEVGEALVTVSEHLESN